METKEVVNELENIIEKIRERTRYNDWASSSFLWERVDEMKKVINQLNNKYEKIQSKRFIKTSN
jgi:hypothetical protein|tara:strand:- start:3490 stop:3681 length:192 start_codon:yes stop_codon:yes gene_type:complete